MKTQIIVQRAWLENLLKYAKNSEEKVGKNYEDSLKYELATLFGFISSAEDILTHQLKE